LEGVREITRRHGTLLAIDETHTICAGPGGCTKAWNLEPDFVIIGKTIGGGVPVAAYGIAESVSRVLEDQMHGHDVDVSGVGGTLSGSAFGMAAMRATLANSLQPADFAKAEPLAIRWTEGVRDVVNSRSLDWHVQRLGVRAEYWFSSPPRNGRDAAASVDSELESYFHLAALNRGVLLTPFHNMALLSPLHSSDDVDVHTRIFEESVNAVVTK
jgi:glutamate-1-semialdehyde 2,1-aminomutase